MRHILDTKKPRRARKAGLVLAAQFGIALLLLAALRVSARSIKAPQSNPPPATPLPAPAIPMKRISVESAEHLVALWVRAHRPHDGTGWQPHPPLKDITTTDVSTRLGAQVFKLRDYTESVDEVEAYLIKKGKVYPLSIGFGGFGLESMCVCDLNHDAKPEFAYTYSWGSGIHRTHLAVLCLDQPSPESVQTDFVYVGDLRLEKENDQAVNVYASDFTQKSKRGKEVLLGRLTLTSKDKHPVLDVALDPGLPKEWREGIWKYKPKVTRSQSQR